MEGKTPVGFAEFAKIPGAEKSHVALLGKRFQIADIFRRKTVLLIAVDIEDPHDLVPLEFQGERDRGAHTHCDNMVFPGRNPVVLEKVVADEGLAGLDHCSGSSAAFRGIVPTGAQILPGSSPDPPDGRYTHGVLRLGPSHPTHGVPNLDDRVANLLQGILDVCTLDDLLIDRVETCNHFMPLADTLLRFLAFVYLPFKLPRHFVERMAQLAEFAMGRRQAGSGR